ncbi:MAG: VCBS repeat-containing protein [Planctomycetota bacterium]
MTSAIPNLPTGQSFVGPQLSASDANFGTRVQTRDEAGNWLDINGDGFVDILVTGREKMRVAYTDGAGGFLATQELTPGSGSNGNDVYDSVCGDLDNDGRVDFYKVRDGTDIYTLNMSTLANGTIAQSADASPSATNGFGANARMVDFDGDGDLDVWVAPVDPDISNCGSNRLELFQNTGLTGANRLQLYTVGGANPWPRAVYDTGFADFDGDGIVDVIMAGCNPDPGYRYFVSDPNAMAITFSTEFIPQANGSKIFSVNNIPDAGGFRRLYNFFDLDASIPVGTGPFMGLTTSVLNQVSIGYPFTADLQPAQDVFQFTISAFAVQAIPVVRQRTALVDFLFGTVELTPVIEETSN